MQRSRRTGLTSLLSGPKLARFVLFFAAIQLIASPILLGWVRLESGGAQNSPILLGVFIALANAILLGAIAFLWLLNSQEEPPETMSVEDARFLAERDPLTGLLNRLGFRTRAERLLKRCASKGQRAVLIQYDADNLKIVNDLYGHPTGDQMLNSIADLIEKAFPKGTLTARLGSDEFAVLIEEDRISESDGIGVLTATTSDDAARGLAVSTSVGFAFFPEDGETLHELMRAADLALISVKNGSKARVSAYRPDMTDDFKKKAWQIDSIRHAAGSGELLPYYQPLVEARTGRLIGSEALVRWNHPELGILAPGWFEHALEDAATAVSVTRVMIDAVTADLGRWWADGYQFKCSLNAGEYDLKHPDFLKMLDAAVNRNHLPPNALTIEVTESAVNTENLEDILPILDALRERGMSIALDDFGTGTSSLTLLRRLPCTAMKIDKSFVTDMTREDDDLSIVRAMTNLGHDLGIDIVAEGVEDDDQVTLLTELGVDILQGHKFGTSLPAAELQRQLETRYAKQFADQQNKADSNLVTLERVKSRRPGRPAVRSPLN